MKIVVFGLTISSSWGNGHATLWRGLCRALDRKRHRLVFYERDTPYYAGARDCWEIPGGELVLYQDWVEVRGRAERDVADADLALVSSYCPDGIAASELVLSGRAMTAFYDLDTPVTLGCLQRGEPLSYVGPAGLSGFDVVFTYTGGRAVNGLRDQLGARRVVPLYGHVNPEVHRPAELAPHYAADLSHLGTFAADRQAALETLLVEPARRRPGQRFLIGGAQYPDDFPWTHNLFFVRHLPPGEHPAFFSSSRLTLNVTRRDMAATGWCPSGRLFEAAACGTAIVSDMWEGLEAFFSPEQEILCARGADDVVSALDLEDAQIRRIARAARERTLAQHTSDHRAEELLRAIGERTAPSSPGRELLEA